MTAVITNYLATRARRAQTRRELNSLSDRELNDIGISRYDIDRLAAETV